MTVELGEGQIAIVTGAGQGIGKAAAEDFAEAGVKVYACDIQGDKVDDLAGSSPNIIPVQMDVTDLDAIARLKDQVRQDESGYLRLLFNSAGWVPHGAMQDITPEDFDKAVALNVRAPTLLTKAFAELMVEQDPSNEKDRAIINMGSVVSDVLGANNRALYTITKAAVTGLTNSTAIDFGGSGIRCNALQPGAFDSESFRQRASDPEARQALIDRQPLGRIGKVEDILQLVNLLATNEYMTGSSVTIDGGWSAFAGAKSPEPPGQ